MTQASVEDICPRPTPEVIRSTWDEVFSDPLLSLSQLQTRGTSKTGLGESTADGGIPLRSVYWRFYHGLLPAPTSLARFESHLQDRRAYYDSLRRKYLVAPDGRWAADCTSPDVTSTRSPAIQYSPRLGGEGESDGQDRWDPLSLDGESPWKSWFAHVDLRTTIRQDVERTFPDIIYFTSETVRKSMVTILFLYSVLNPDVGYRQGIHELLAICYLVVDQDSIVAPALNIKASPLSSVSEQELRTQTMYSTLDRRYVEHDAFVLFLALMKDAKPFYEWRAEEGPASSSSVAVAPIIKRANNLHSNLLRRIDPQLWETLETEGVEAQIWAIRWIRLIFTRELPFPQALRLWDGIFAQDPELDILDFVCIAMLLLIRNELLGADYPTLLTNLLHYPSPSLTYPFSPFLILTQAAFLRDQITPAAGVEVVMQNQSILSIKAQPPERAERSAGRHDPRNRPVTTPVRPPPRGMQGLASGLFERAQAAGLDKAIMSTVADLRRNLPDTATAYSYLPNLSFSASPHAREVSGPYSAIPTSQSSTSFSPALKYTQSFPSHLDTPTATKATSQRSPIIPIQGTEPDTEQQLADLKLAMVHMGRAMSQFLESPPEASKAGLEKIRDTLLEAGASDTAEVVREWSTEGMSPAINQDGNTSRQPEVASPSDTSEDGKVEAQDDGMERVPLRPTSSRSPDPAKTELPPTHSTPGPRTSMPTATRPSGSDNGPSLPSLHLSMRNDRPSTGLPRVPVTAPVTRRQTPNDTPIQPSTTEIRRPQTSSSTGVMGGDEARKPNLAPDPLAGLGVSVGPRSDFRRVSPRMEEPKRTQDRTQGNGVDPLLGRDL